MTSIASLEYFKGVPCDEDPIRDLLPNPDHYVVEDLYYCSLTPSKTQSEDFLLVPHQSLWHYWQNLRGSNAIARYTNINPMDFGGAIGFVLLLEPNADLTDFRYRVYGSSVASRFGREMTGKWLSDFGDAPGKLSLAQYPAVIKTRLPLYSEHNAAHEEFTTTRWCRLILPLENTDGEIDRILVGTVPKEK